MLLLYATDNYFKFKKLKSTPDATLIRLDSEKPLDATVPAKPPTEPNTSSNPLN